MISKPGVQFSLKGFSTGDSFAPEGTLGNICRHFWLSQLGAGCCATGMYQVESRDATGHPTMLRIAPHDKELFDPKREWCYCWETLGYSDGPYYNVVQLCRSQESGLDTVTIFRLSRRMDIQDHISSDLLWLFSLATEFLSELSYCYSLRLTYKAALPALHIVDEGIIISKEKVTV